jgi:hypothetical protein
MGLQKVANGDAKFWLMQGTPNHRLTPCAVYCQFDIPANESMVRDRLDDLATSYAMFNRNIVEVLNSGQSLNYNPWPWPSLLNSSVHLLPFIKTSHAGFVLLNSRHDLLY